MVEEQTRLAEAAASGLRDEGRPSRRRLRLGEEMQRVRGEAEAEASRMALELLNARAAVEAGGGVGTGGEGTL